MDSNKNTYEIEVRQILETELQNNETLLEYTYGSLFYSLPSVSVYAGLTSERLLIIKESFLSGTKKTYSIPMNFIETISWDPNHSSLKIDLSKDSIQIKCRDL